MAFVFSVPSKVSGRPDKTTILRCRPSLYPRPMATPLRNRSAPSTSAPLRPKRSARRIAVISNAALDQEAKLRKKSVLSGTAGALVGITLHLASATIFLHIAEGWALLDALYFAVVIATTVGYGDITPMRAASKIFVAIYAIVSVALIAGMLQALVERVADAQTTFTNSTTRRLLASTTNTREDAGHGDLVIAARKSVRYARTRLWATTCMLLGACLSGALLYGRFLNAGYVDLFYFLCVSMTTVGLGDIHPVSAPGKAYAAIWLVLTSLGFASMISQYADLRVKEKQSDMIQRMLEGDISDHMFKEIDDDGSGSLSEAEFLGYMMCKLGKASPDDVRGILQRFRELDTDGSGVITKEEVISMRKKIV